MIQIRAASVADLPAIVEFNCRLAEETEHKQLDRATITRGVQRALDQPSLCRYFVAEVGGLVIGQTMITFELTDWRDGLFYWLQSVYVEPSQRSQGVFRALFEHVLAAARQDPDVRGVRLYAEHENVAALATYQRLGFKPSGHALYEIDWSGATRAVE